MADKTRSYTDWFTETDTCRHGPHTHDMCVNIV